MFRKSLLATFILSMIISFATVSYAFDGNRQGFILGAGVGPGLTSYNWEVGNYKSDSENKFSLITDFKIGYGPSNQLLIYWMSKVAWFSIEKGYGESTIYLNGVAGLGLSYYLEPEGASPYLTGGIGYSSFGEPFEENADAEYGPGIALGAGYEFAKHWSIEGNFTWSSPGNYNALGIRFTINGLAY